MVVYVNPQQDEEEQRDIKDLESQMKHYLGHTIYPMVMIGDFNPNGKALMRTITKQYPVTPEIEKRTMFTRLFKVKEEVRTGQPDEIYTRQVTKPAIKPNSTT